MKKFIEGFITGLTNRSAKQKRMTPRASYSTSAAADPSQMDTRNPQESALLGMQLYLVIEEYRRAHGDKWHWESCLPAKDFGDSGKYDPDLVCRTAGCWYSFTEEDMLRFYCNQNHEEHGGRPTW